MGAAGIGNGGPVNINCCCFRRSVADLSGIISDNQRYPESSLFIIAMGDADPLTGRTVTKIPGTGEMITVFVC